MSLFGSYSIGRIVFLRLRNSNDPRLFPAKIKSAIKGVATLEWQLGLIDWASGRRVKKPASRDFSCLVQECVQAWSSVRIDARNLKVSQDIYYLYDDRYAHIFLSNLTSS